MELGYIVGNSIPKLTSALGTLLGGVRYAALATFLIRSPDIYTKYRNRMKKKFDFFYEHQQWGCDHSQISAFLIKELGFTKDIIQIAKVLRKTLSPGEVISPEMQVWHAGLCWIDGIKDGKIPPEEKIAIDALKATSTETAAVRAGTEKLFKEGATFTWMLRKFGGEEKTEGESEEK